MGLCPAGLDEWTPSTSRSALAVTADSRSRESRRAVDDHVVQLDGDGSRGVAAEDVTPEPSAAASSARLVLVDAIELSWQRARYREAGGRRARRTDDIAAVVVAAIACRRIATRHWSRSGSRVGASVVKAPHTNRTRLRFRLVSPQRPVRLTTRYHALA